MRLMSKIILAVFLMYGSPAFAQDPVLYAKDSVIEVNEDADCYTNFFQRGEMIKTPGSFMVLGKTGKVSSLKTFLNAYDIEKGNEYMLIDLDKDGKKELVIHNYTGGAHCCDEFYFLKYVSPNRYQLTSKLFAGDVCVDESNVFEYNFHQQLGYFFTCFACSYEDSTDAAPVPVSSVEIKYNKGKLVVVPGTKELRSTINDNLAKLGELPYQAVDPELGQDGGQRKAIAMNIVVFYYSFGKNLVETQKLFNKYYKHPDAKKVWAELLKQFQYISKDSSI
jgi:hypothetical protein